HRDDPLLQLAVDGSAVAPLDAGHGSASDTAHAAGDREIGKGQPAAGGVGASALRARPGVGVGGGGLGPGRGAGVPGGEAGGGRGRPEWPRGGGPPGTVRTSRAHTGFGRACDPWRWFLLWETGVVCNYNTTTRPVNGAGNPTDGRGPARLPRGAGGRDNRPRI